MSLVEPQDADLGPVEDTQNVVLPFGADCGPINGVLSEGEEDPLSDSVASPSDAEASAALNLLSMAGGDKAVEWGACIEFECPTKSVCIKVDKLLAQPRASDAAVDMPACDPPAPAVERPARDWEYKEVSSKVKDCEDSLVRYGILFEQAVQRIDGQLQHIINWQRNSGKNQDDLRRKVDALISEIGVDVVKARLQQMEQETQHRQQQRFGGGARARETQFSMEMGDQGRAYQQDGSYHRRGNGRNRRNRAF